MADLGLHLALGGLGLPAVLAAALMVLGKRPWRRPAREAGGWSEPLALAAAFAAAYLWTRGLPPWPPREALDWLLGLGLLAGVLGALDAHLRPPAWLRIGLALPLMGAVPTLVLWPILEHEWSAWQAVANLAGLGAMLFGLWSALDRIGRRASGPALPLGLWLAAGGGALSLALSGTATWALMGVSVSVALGILWLLESFRSGAEAGRAAAAPFTVLMGGLWIAGAFYAELPAASLGMLVLGSLAVGLVPLVTGSGMGERGLAWTLIRIAPVALLAAASVTWAWLASPPLA
jgi:hypothetical protein